MTISEPPPAYTFTKPLSKKIEGFTRHETICECTVSNSLAAVSWYRGTNKITVSIELC